MFELLGVFLKFFISIFCCLSDLVCLMVCHTHYTGIIFFYWVSVCYSNASLLLLLSVCLLLSAMARLTGINAVWEQRALYTRRALSEIQTQQLDKLKFAWDTMYLSLVEFHRKHSHVNVPMHKTADKPYFALGQFVASMRRSYHQKRLLPRFFDKLERLGFDWNWNEGKDAQTPKVDTRQGINCPSRGNSAIASPD